MPKIVCPQRIHTKIRKIVRTLLQDDCILLSDLPQILKEEKCIHKPSAHMTWLELELRGGWRFPTTTMDYYRGRAFFYDARTTSLETSIQNAHNRIDRQWEMESERRRTVEK